VRIYFSGGGRPAPEELLASRNPHIMLSFHDLYSNDRATHKRFLRFIAKKQQEPPNGGSLFLDSGAFTYSQKEPSGFSLEKGSSFRDYAERYAACLQDMKGVPDFLYANLDVIGKPEKTWETQQFLEGYGLNPIPVVHCGSPLRYLERYLELGHEFIGLGGMVGKSQSEKRTFCDEAFRLICPESNGRMPLAKIHGFAMFSHELMLRYPWWSVDSTTWLKPATYGRVYTPRWSADKNDWDFRKRYRIINFSWCSPEQRKRTSCHFTRQGKHCQREIYNWLDEIETDDFVCEYLTHYRVEANLHYWLRFQEKLPAWPYSWGNLQNPPMKKR
jgi:hypothetical protein